ncbi:Sulfate permease, MFS superfamily [Granulicella pectinivorans]|uniref:Sulfate permease, MFS superfamily n=2 Tax=Granulicella pectinivorans TaxID=474950 RepID=A0A1I6MY93_9BACT|nr:Sulfate permease, MFS superfamily [Granulicella pectinivorans]
MKPAYIKDLSASLVVFLIALPLCMGIALASGAPPAAGILTGIIGGIVVGFLAGAPLQVSGPAAGLAVIIFEIIRDQGFSALGPILVIAGALQILAGVIKAGRWFRAISPAVIHGMLAGIGLLIVLQQFHVMLDNKPKGTGLANAKAIWPAITQGIFPIDGSREEVAVLLALMVIGIMVLWQKYRPQSLKLVPGALLGITAATVIARVMHLELNYVQVPGNLLDVVHLPTLEAFTSIHAKTLGSAATIAFIASAETLLSAAAVDKMQSIVKTNYDRELMAQGAGNMLCGVVGAIPMTGVIVRSSANVQAGATSRLSAILHGVWILAMIVLLPGVLRMVPICSLAGVLVFTGFNLIKVKDMRHLSKFGRVPVLIYVATMLTIVATDLLTGVLTGVVLSLVKLIYRSTHLRIYSVAHKHPTAFDTQAANVVDLHIEGSATFLRIPIITAALDAIPAGSIVHLRTDKLTYIDHACLDLMQDWINNQARNQLEIVVDRESLEKKYWLPATQS